MAAALVFSVVIFLFSFELGHVSAFLKPRLFVFLGLISYSIYMVHWLIQNLFVIAGKLAEKIFSVQAFLDPGSPKLGTSTLQGDLLVVVYFCVVIGVSYTTYRYIEKPCRE